MLSLYCHLYLICLPGFTDQKILGISVPVNLCFNQSAFLLYWQKVKFHIRIFSVNKDCNRGMARFPSVFDTNPPATAWVVVGFDSSIEWQIYYLFPYPSSIQFQ